MGPAKMVISSVDYEHGVTALVSGAQPEKLVTGTVCVTGTVKVAGTVRVAGTVSDCFTAMVRAGGCRCVQVCRCAQVVQGRHVQMSLVFSVLVHFIFFPSSAHAVQRVR